MKSKWLVSRHVGSNFVTGKQRMAYQTKRDDSVQRQYGQTRKLTSWWGQCETRRHLSQSGSRILWCLPVTCSENVYAPPRIYSYVRLERDNNTKSQWAFYVTRRRRQVHLSLHFGGKGAKKCPTAYTRGNEACESQFRKLYTFSESVESSSINRDPNMTKNEHVYAICCQPEVAGDVISGGNVKTIKGYALLNFEAASFYSSFRANQNQPFV